MSISIFVCALSASDSITAKGAKPAWASHMSSALRWASVIRLAYRASKAARNSFTFSLNRAWGVGAGWPSARGPPSRRASA